MKFPFKPYRVIFAEVCCAPGDGDNSQAEPPKHCESGGLLQAHRSSCSAEAMLWSLLLFSPTSVSQRLLFFNRMAASSARLGNANCN